ncbi:Protein FAR1-related sequence 5 [Vitis vinifera]|uniref:Protein FAR1-related sequence 5 n=1 Tax=Vitis vinifera TaxID=29760 RepID=A0A438CKW4_VITVI|nr:Protein FAR1-related sequence 5 [Vitis vinifera]
MQSVKEKTIKWEFEVKEEDVVNDDAYTGGTYHLGGNGLKEKMLKGISDEERDKNGDIISQKWVCSREGQRATKFIENDKRQREPRSLTRVGYEAAFRIGLNRKDGKWIVKEFIGKHNHNLVDAINTQFLQSHRIISNPDKAQIDVLRKVGVKTTQIMDYMVKQSGGHQHVGFTEKDMYNHVDAMRRIEIKDGDVEAALAYLAILRIRKNEAKAEFESNNSSPVLSTKLSILENHAATVYTKESFLKFWEEMKNAELFFVIGLLSGAFGRDSSFMYFEEVDKISKDAYKISTGESDE